MPVSAGRTCLCPDMSASCWLSLIALQPIHLPTPSRKGTHMNLRITAALALLTLGAGAHAASLSATGYAQNFNGMGTGNVAPEGWSVLTANTRTTNNTGSSGPAPSPAPPARVPATWPTTASGGALQLSLSNDTGYAFDSLTVSYD